MISSKIIHQYKIRVSKKTEIHKRRDTNQIKRIKKKKTNVSVHPDIELEKTSHHLGLSYKACLHPPTPTRTPYVSCLMSFNVLIFISSFIIEKEHLASFCCTKQEEKSSCVCCLLTLRASLSFSQGSRCLSES